MLEVGKPAPSFTLPDADGNPVSLEDLKGSPVLVYFYPRDDTPGCTTQACGIRDSWAEFQSEGAIVLGVSPDNEAAHAKFRDKYDLPHTLLADPDKTMIEAYGAWGERNMYGKKFMGVIRSTVLIDAAGNVAQVWPKVRPKEHAEQVLESIRALT